MCVWVYQRTEEEVRERGERGARESESERRRAREREGERERESE